MWDIYSTDVDETGIGYGLYILAECEARHASSDPYSSDTKFDELLEFRLLGDIHGCSSSLGLPVSVRTCT